MAKTEVSKEGQKRVSEKIRHLRREGKSTEEAAGAAYGMEEEGRLGPRGGYRRGKRRSMRRSSRR